MYYIIEKTIQCSTCDSEGELEVLLPESLRNNGVI